jgi:tRNA pseudouridine38-40 synthase
MLEALDVREDGDLIVFRVYGSHFIWKLVRRLVGVIVEVGRGGLSVDEAAGLLSSDSGVPARFTAPASGLFVASVRYKGDRPDQGRLLLGGVTPFSRR